MKTRAIVVGVLVVLVVGWLVWGYAVPHTTLSEGPMTYSQAQAISPAALPPAAENIRVATFRHMMDTTTYIKFDAPLKDCRTMAQKLLPGVMPEAIKVAATQKDDLPPPQSSKHFTARQLEWFDAHRVTAGERYAGAGGQLVVIWMRPEGSAELPTLYYRRGE